MMNERANHLHRPHRRGIALMLVVAVVALASILGLVMLSTATLANRSGANQERLMSGEYLAQSGVNLAMYYLQHPDRAPSVNADGYWPGTGGELAISSSVQGTVNVTVTRDSSNPWAYEVVSVGTAGVQGDTQITRTTGARLLVRQAFDVKYAMNSNVDTNLNAGFAVSGDAYTNLKLNLKGALGFAPAATVSGIGYCTSSSGSVGIPTGKWSTLSSTAPAGAPLSAAIFNYKTGYYWGDQLYNADVIDASSTSSWTATSPTASASNPAHVFYVRDSMLGSSGTFTLNSSVVVNGTLVVDGNLNVRGSGIVITPVTSAYPALIVTGTMDVAQKQKSITVNGTCFIGTQLKSTTVPAGNNPLSLAEYSRFTVNGGLLFGTLSGTAPVATLYTPITTVTYNAASPPAPIQLKTAKGVSVLRWGLP
jgi:Tfp pilus assembly protein PilX